MRQRDYVALGLSAGVIALALLTRTPAEAASPAKKSSPPSPTPPGPTPPNPTPPRPPARYTYPVGSVVDAQVRLADGSRSPVGAFKIISNVRALNTTDKQGVVHDYAVQEADCMFFCDTWFIDAADIVENR